MKQNGIIPEILVKDIKKSFDFYTKILGFKILVGDPDDDYVHLKRGNAEIMLEKIDGKWDNWVTKELKYPLGRGLNLKLEVEDVNRILRLLNKNKIPPPIQGYGRKMVAS